MHSTPLICRCARRIQILQLNHIKPTNPISEAIRVALCKALVDAEGDVSVDAIVVTGGPGRSFSAGGDFAEVSQLNSAQAVGGWIERTVEMYKAVLSVSKPVVMAIEGHAIGAGLQLALMGDWRVASYDSSMSMWELKAGVACTIGSTILHHCLGRNAATQLIYGCNAVTGEEAKRLNLVDDVVASTDLERCAIQRAEQFAKYPKVPFAMTKESINGELIDKLERSILGSIRAHVSSFGAHSSESHMRAILGRRIGIV